MVKELKYLFFLVIIFFFIFFTVKYYFSDNHKKKSYRSYNSINEKIETLTENLLILESDTNDIIFYVDNNNNKNKKKYKFWNLLNDD
jgi:hypothetical protein